tara:strand:- start:219 stop:1772 length:1554 start_codon:yes stop_codon:yes gene_type:complete
MSQIVDINGVPIHSTDFKYNQTEQDSRIGMLMRQYAEHPSEGLTPAKLAMLLKEADAGNLAAMADLAKDMEDKDGHLFSELTKRRRSWLKYDWSVEPPRNATPQEEKDAAAIQEVLEDATWFDDLIFDCSDAILKSFSCNELTWAYEAGEHYISGYEFRDQNLFQTHPNDRNQLMLRDNSYTGQALNPFGWCTHVHRSKSGYIHRTGLTSTVAWPYLFKNYSIRDLAEFLEIYGLPLRLGKYPNGASEDEKSTLLRAVLSIGHNAGGIIPKGMEIDFQNAANGQSDPFEAMIKWCETTQSKAVLGATLTSQADGKTSTNALGNVHMEVLNDITESDLKQVANTITRDIIYPMFALNSKSYSGPRRIPRFKFDTSEAEDIANLAPALKTLVEINYPIPTKWVSEKTQIPLPDKGESILTLHQEQPTAELKGFAALKSTPQKDNADLMAEQLAAQAQTHLNSMSAAVTELVKNASSLEEIRDGIIELEPQISTEGFTELMAKAMAASELLGALEVDEGR